MLRVESEKQMKHIGDMCSFSIIDIDEKGIYLDTFITFDEMAMIVDYLRAKKT